MARYIDVDKLKEAYKLDDYGVCNWEEVLKIVDNEDIAPTEDVMPVVHAEWIKHNIKLFKNHTTIMMCSRCNFIKYDFSHDDYCRFCGAKMDLNGGD